MTSPGLRVDEPEGNRFPRTASVAKLNRRCNRFATCPDLKEIDPSPTRRRLGMVTRRGLLESASQ